MLGMGVVSTVALCVAVAFVVILMVVAKMGPKQVQKQREFRRRGIS
jgi:hypothetical protein